MRRRPNSGIILPSVPNVPGTEVRAEDLQALLKREKRVSLGGKRDDLEGRFFRSSWEANWARYLNWLKAHGEIRTWSYEPETFEFPLARGTRFYTPDFLVVHRDGTRNYHEIKGYMDRISATKLKRMAQYHPNITIVVIDGEAYRQVKTVFGPLIPHWEWAA